jgi:AraC-like DNA-binding protein
MKSRDKSDFGTDMIAGNMLRLSPTCPVKALNAGLFISRGKGSHPARSIDSHELIFVKRGYLELREEDLSFCLPAGHALHLWPNRQHSGSAPFPPDLSFYWIHFEVQSSELPDEPTIEVPQVMQVGRPERLEHLFRHFLDDQEAGQLEQHAANLLVMLMLCELARDANQDALAANEATLAGQAEAYIRLHYDQSISATVVANALGYNVDYLGRIFHKVYGHTLTDAIHIRRLRIARNHLLDSSMTVEDIARACGFTDAGYFRRIFYRHQGMSPSAFRRQFARYHVNTE